MQVDHAAIQFNIPTHQAASKPCDNLTPMQNQLKPKHHFGSYSTSCCCAQHKHWSSMSIRTCWMPCMVTRLPGHWVWSRHLQAAT